MSKILIDDLLDETSFLSDANLRFQQIEDEFNDKVLYRNNPLGEPNGMFNDLDMQKNDLLNIGIIHAEALYINGIIVDGSPPIWGTITGTLEDQVDLDNALQDAHDFGIWDVGVKVDTTLEILSREARFTNLALEWDRLDEKFPALNFTDRLNKGPGGLITLNNNSKIPQELIDASITKIIGFFRADDICLNKPPTCIVPDYRNPSQIDPARVFNNGESFIIFFGEGETAGSVNLVDPQDPLGGLIVVEVFDGDAITYIEEVVGFSQAGWFLWKNAVVVNVASNVTYNSVLNISNKIIKSTSDNVQVALDDVDNFALSTRQWSNGDGVTPLPLQTVLGKVDFNNILTINGSAIIDSNVTASVTTVVTLNGSTLVPNIDTTDVAPPNNRQAVDYGYVKDLKDKLGALVNRVTELENQLLGVAPNPGAISPGTVIDEIDARVGVHDNQTADAGQWGHVTFTENPPGSGSLLITFDDPTP